MLTSDVRFDGFTTQDWTRLAQAFRPRNPAETPKPRSVEREVATNPVVRRGGVVVVTQGDRPVKLLSTESGRVDFSGRTAPPSVADSAPRSAELKNTGPSGAALSAFEWPVSLESLAAAFDARWAVELEWGALDALMDSWASKLLPAHDAFDQTVELIRAAAELESQGKLRAWPWTISAWPLPNQRLRLRALDAICPDGKALLLGVFKGGALFTSVALRRRGAGFDWILGPAALREDMGLVSGDWTRDYRHLLRAVERNMGSVAVGCFAELHTLQKLSEGDLPGGWAAAVASRDVVLAPVVPALAIPLGVDAGRAAYFAIRDLAERVGVGGFFGEASPLAPAFERVKAAVEDRDVVGLLGFDPIELLRKLLAKSGRDA